MASNDSDSLSNFKSRTRAPIFWILLPLISGYLIGQKIPQFSGYFLVMIGLGVGFIWGFAWWVSQKKHWYWKYVGTLSIVVISWGYLLLHLPPNLDWEKKPEREAYLTLKIKHTFPLEAKYNRQIGYGEVVNAPNHLASLIGQKVYYSIYKNKAKPSSTFTRSEIVEVKGQLAAILHNSENNFEKYLFSQGIRFKLYKGQMLQTKIDANRFYKFCAKQNQKLEEILDKGKNTKNEYAASIYKAMLLGNKASLTEEQKYAFRTTGSLHLFAISGLHVGVIAGCLAFLLRLIKLQQPWAAIVGLTILFLYVEITGGTPSAMRAFFMVLFYWGGRAFKRKSSAFSALLASALVALILDPFDLWNIGFQLSYAVVGSILLYGLPLNEIINNSINISLRRTPTLVKNGLKWLSNLLGISIAANIGTVFLSIRYFNIFAPGSIFLSIIIIPLASIVIIIGFISLLTGLIGLNFIPQLVNPISWGIIQIMETVIAFSLTIPGLFWESFGANPLLTYISFGLLFAFLYWGHRCNKLQKVLFYLMPMGVISVFIVCGF